MIRIPRACFALAVVLLPITAFAQQKPDFAGRWTSEPADAAQGGRGGRGEGARGGGGQGRSGDMGSGWGPTITITQDAAKLTVEYAFFARGDMQPPLRFVYAFDGSPTKNTVMMGRGMQEQTSTAKWDGERFVVTTMHPFQNPENGAEMKAEVRQVLSLESPNSLIVETTRVGVLGGASTTTRTTYRKIP